MTTTPDLDTRIAEIRALEKRATEGPWKDEAGYNNAGCPSRFLYIPGHNGGDEEDDGTVEMLEDDSALIVAMRNSIADILEDRDLRLVVPPTALAEAYVASKSVCRCAEGEPECNPCEYRSAVGDMLIDFVAKQMAEGQPLRAAYNRKAEQQSGQK